MPNEELDILPQSTGGVPILLRGDADFWGPPTFRFRLWFENRDQVIYMLLRARWEEPKPDFTTFEWNTERVLVDIRSRKGPDWYFVQYRNQYDLDVGEVQIPGINLGLQEVYNQNEGAIQLIRAVGDSYGGWFGGADNPRIEIDFNHIYLTVSNNPR
jgi:hypothetical protein